MTLIPIQSLLNGLELLQDDPLAKEELRDFLETQVDLDADGEISQAEFDGIDILSFEYRELFGLDQDDFKVNTFNQIAKRFADNIHGSGLASDLITESEFVGDLAIQEVAVDDEWQQGILSDYYSPEQAFTRVKEWQINRYLDQIAHIDHLTQDLGSGFSITSVQYFSYYLRGKCDGDLCAFQNIKNALQKNVEMEPYEIETASTDMCAQFSQLLQTLGVEQDLLKSIRQQYSQKGIDEKVSESCFVDIDPVTDELIGDFLNINAHAMNVVLAKIEESEGIKKQKDKLNDTRDDLNALKNIAREKNNPGFMVDVLNGYQTPELKEYLYRNVIGIEPDIVELAKAEGEKPADCNGAEWDLAQFIAQTESEVGVFRQIGHEVGHWMDRFSPFSYWESTDGFWDTINPLEYGIENIYRMTDSIGAVLAEDSTEEYLLETASSSFFADDVSVMSAVIERSVFPLKKPLKNEAAQLKEIKKVMQPGYEKSLEAIQYLRSKTSFGDGVAINNVVLHLFKLTVAGLAEERVDYRAKAQVDNILRFLRVTMGTDPFVENVAEYFFQSLRALEIDGQSIHQWAQSHYLEFDRALNFDEGQIVPNLLNLPDSLNVLSEKLLLDHPELISQLDSIDDETVTIKIKQDAAFRTTRSPIKLLDKKLATLEKDTTDIIFDIESLEGSGGVFRLLSTYCPNPQAQEYLLSHIGVDSRVMQAPEKPEWMSEDEWHHTKNFGDQFQQYQKVEGTAQRVNMAAFMFLCMAGAFAGGPFALLAMGGGVLMAGIDINRESAKLARTEVSVVAGEHTEVLGNARLSDLENAEQDLADAYISGTITVASIITSYGVSQSLRANIPNRVVRIALDAGFSAGDAGTTVAGDRRTHRYMSPEDVEKEVLIAALFAACGATLGEIVGGARPKPKKIRGQYGQIDGNKHGLLITPEGGDGRSFLIELDPGAKLALSEGDPVILRDPDTGMELRLTGIDANGRVDFVMIPQRVVSNTDPVKTYEVRSFEQASIKALELTQQTGREHSYFKTSDGYIVVEGDPVTAYSGILAETASPAERRFFGVELAGHTHASKESPVASLQDFRLVAGEAGHNGRSDVVEVSGFGKNGETIRYQLRVEFEDGQVRVSIDDPDGVLARDFGDDLAQAREHARQAEEEANGFLREADQDGLRRMASENMAARLIDGDFYNRPNQDQLSGFIEGVVNRHGDQLSRVSENERTFYYIGHDNKKYKVVIEAVDRISVSTDKGELVGVFTKGEDARLPGLDCFFKDSSELQSRPAARLIDDPEMRVDDSSRSNLRSDDSPLRESPSQTRGGLRSLGDIIRCIPAKLEGILPQRAKDWKSILFGRETVGGRVSYMDELAAYFRTFDVDALPKEEAKKLATQADLDIRKNINDRGDSASKAYARGQNHVFGKIPPNAYVQEIPIHSMCRFYSTANSIVMAAKRVGIQIDVSTMDRIVRLSYNIYMQNKRGSSAEVLLSSQKDLVFAYNKAFEELGINLQLHERYFKSGYGGENLPANSFKPGGSYDSGDVFAIFSMVDGFSVKYDDGTTKTNHAISIIDIDPQRGVTFLNQETGKTSHYTSEEFARHVQEWPEGSYNFEYYTFEQSGRGRVDIGTAASELSHVDWSRVDSSVFDVVVQKSDGS